MPIRPLPLSVKATCEIREVLPGSCLHAKRFVHLKRKSFWIETEGESLKCPRNKWLIFCWFIHRSSTKLDTPIFTFVNSAKPVRSFLRIFRSQSELREYWEDLASTVCQSSEKLYSTAACLTVRLFTLCFSLTEGSFSITCKSVSLAAPIWMQCLAAVIHPKVSQAILRWGILQVVYISIFNE